MKKTSWEASISKSLPYVRELRRRLVLVLVFFLLAFLGGFSFFRQILGLFFRLFNLPQVEMVVTSPFQVFTLAVNTGIVLGVAAALPLMIFQLVAFIKPALRKEERAKILPFCLFSFLLFFFGFGFGLVLMRSVVFGFSQTLLAVKVSNYWDIGLFLSQVLVTSVCLGAIFQLPLILWLAVELGFVSAATLRRQRRWLMAGSFLFVALLPPTDAFSLVLMVIPLMGLFELTLAFLPKASKGGEALCLVG